MPFFNFRRTGPSSTPPGASNALPESVEVVRKRAKHRLIGAAVLVLAGVVGFPLLFDTQPRPVAVDIPIEIPSKNAVKPLVMPARPQATAPSSAPVVAAGKVTDASSLTSKEELLAEKKPVAPAKPTGLAIKNEAKPAPLAEARPPVKAEARPLAKADAAPVAKPVAPVDDGARAKALLNGQAPAVAASPATVSSAAPGVEGRLVVQVGAFADVTKAREARLKLEKAGLKTYTQVAETKDGKRIRVRVGPFASKAEADKAASKIRGLDLPAAILTL